MKLRTTSILAGVACGVLLGANATAQAGNNTESSHSATTGADVVEVWKVERRGRPPFRRERVELPVMDLAVAETPDVETLETVERWEVDTRGKPPYTRRRVELPVVDAAAMEILESGAAERPRFRGKPPFRRH